MGLKSHLPSGTLTNTHLRHPHLPPGKYSTPIGRAARGRVRLLRFSKVASMTQVRESISAARDQEYLPVLDALIELWRIFSLPLGNG